MQLMEYLYRHHCIQPIVLPEVLKPGPPELEPVPCVTFVKWLPGMKAAQHAEAVHRDFDIVRPLLSSLRIAAIIGEQGMVHLKRVPNVIC